MDAARTRNAIEQAGHINAAETHLEEAYRHMWAACDHLRAVKATRAICVGTLAALVLDEKERL